MLQQNAEFGTESLVHSLSCRHLVLEPSFKKICKNVTQTKWMKKKNEKKKLSLN